MNELALHRVVPGVRLTRRSMWASWVAVTWHAVMPRNRKLSEASWRRRHRSLVALLCLMLAGTIPFSSGVRIGQVWFMVIPAGIAVAAAQLVRGRDLQSVFVTCGLFACASTYVTLAGGVTEAHLLYFVLIGVISLYQNWRPFLVGICLVLVNHIVLGMLVPVAVFGGGHAATVSPSEAIRLAGIHTAFLFASSVASIVAWKSSEEQLLHDDLTGLPNRRLLSEHLERLLSISPHSTLTVFYLDLCGFKKVNDVYGHDAGDLLLVEVAARLSAAVGPDEVVARIGGDEFAIVLPTAGARRATAAALRIGNVCATPIVVDTRVVCVPASIGVVVVSAASGQRAFEILRDADLAMYAAKREFGDSGGFSVFREAMRDDARAEFELELDLHSCVDNDELVLDYQPIVDMVSGRTIGAEALVRWMHPTRGLLGPMTFIPLAERTGDIVDIGRWVMATAVHQLGEWNELAGPDVAPLTMHVNVSTHQLRNSSFLADMTSIVAGEAVSPEQVVVEVTESALLGGERDRLVLRRLKSIGVGLALDDFGTGYSSLSHLASLPVDNLKLDKSFTDDVPVGPNRTLLAGMLALTGQLGFTPIVEGIERPEQVRELLAMGARLGQGYFFSRPLSAERFAARIATQQRRRPGTCFDECPDDCPDDCSITSIAG